MFSVSFHRYDPPSGYEHSTFPHSRQPAARDDLDLGKADGIDLDDGKDAGRDGLACCGGGDGWGWGWGSWWKGLSTVLVFRKNRDNKGGDNPLSRAVTWPSPPGGRFSGTGVKVTVGVKTSARLSFSPDLHQRQPR